MKIKEAGQIIKSTFSDFMDDKALRLAAAMAYYTIFAIGPLLIMIIGIVGLLMEADSVREEISAQLKANLGPKSEEIVTSMMSAKNKGGGLMATIVGGIALVLGASGVFGQLQDSLNTIWDVKPKSGRGIWGVIRTRFLSMAMVLGTGFLLLVSMALSAVVAASTEYIERVISVPAFVLTILHVVLSLGVFTLLFALIFKVLPDVRIRWKDVWVGAFATAVLFAVGKFALSFYLGKQGTESTYGAGTGLILILLYIYYSAVILFLGAEFTQVHARRYGARIVPSDHAEFVSPEAADRAEKCGGWGKKSGPPGKQSSGSGKKSGGLAPAPAWAASRVVPRRAGDYRTAPQSMGSSSKKTGAVLPAPVGHAPIERIRAHRGSFVSLAVVAGVAGTLLWRFKFLRKVLSIAVAARRIV